MSLSTFEEELQDYINKALREMIQQHEKNPEPIIIKDDKTTLFEVMDQTFKINWPDYKLLSVEFNDDETELIFEYDEPEETN